MRTISLFAAIAAVGLALPSSAHASDLSVTAIIQKHNLSPIEAAAAVVIADALGLDATFVINTGRRTNQSLIVLGPAFYISSHCHKPVIEVWNHRKKGKGWGNIAKEMGMHPGTFNKMRVKGEFDDVAWYHLLNRSCGATSVSIHGLEGRGMKMGDVVAAYAYSNGDKSKLRLIASNWKDDKDWKSDKWRGGSPGHGDSQGKAHGNGNNQGGGKGKGNGNGQGKGHGGDHGRG